MLKIRRRQEPAARAVVLASDAPHRRQRFDLVPIGGKARELGAWMRAGPRRSGVGRPKGFRLEDLAGAVGPVALFAGRRARRRPLAVGGAGLAIVAALGAGVAVGFMLRRKLKARKARQEAQDAAALPAEMGRTPVSASLDL